MRRLEIDNFSIMPPDIINVIIDNVPSAIILFDKTGKIFSANHRGRELCSPNCQGFSIDEFFNEIKALKPDNSKFPLEEIPIYRTLKTGHEARNAEMTIQRPNGERVPISVSSIPICGNSKEVAAIIGVIDEIFEHKKVEKTLRESERRFRLVAQAANILLYEIYLKENNMAVFTGEEVLGYAKGELPTNLDWWLHQIHPDDQQATRQKVKKAIETGQDTYLECRFKRKQGDYIIIHDTEKMIKNEHGETVSIFGGIKDVTEYKKGEVILKEKGERLELAQSVAHMGSWEYCLKEDCATWSKELYNIFGLDPQKTAPNTVEYLKMVHPDEFEEFTEKTKKFALYGKLGETLAIDYRIIKPDGSTRDIHSVRMVRDSESGVNTRIVGIEQDITERMQIERQLAQYSKNLEKLVEERTCQLQEKERLAAIGETAAMVGHDIRNPLQTIINELFLDRQMFSGSDVLDKTDLLGSLNLIQEQVDYISKIVSDLQDYARPLKPEYTETSLADLIVSTFDAIQVPKDIDLAVEADDRLVFRTDRVFLKRALTNLVNNAIQAMPQGGQLKLGAYRKDNFVVIAVSDTGPGIPEEVKARLFRPLVTTKSKGQGFGLAVVKRLVEALGGRISFESEIGKGTKFVIELPTDKP